MFALLAEAREVSNPELEERVGFRLVGKEHRKLKDLKLVTGPEDRRPYAHELTDAGWRWCNDELSAGPGAGRGSKDIERALYAILAGLGRYLEVIAMLSDLPEEAWTLGKSSAMAAELAERLKAARINDPLFGGSGQSADPGVLLTPSPGKRARVSVISLSWLRGLERRQSFVNQLQMALFSWINKHPAGDRPLGGLFVMDEAQDLVPSRGVTVCTESTLRLASQARKYGLGLLFATQSPTGLHNQVPGNATTQFYGLLSHPTQIDRGRDFARAKGGDLPEIGRLTPGQFYLGAEGRKFQKIRTPMCLSHHASPLTEDEIIARANRSGQGGPLFT
jgi:hypothetical protein